MEHGNVVQNYETENQIVGGCVLLIMAHGNYLCSLYL